AYVVCSAATCRLLSIRLLVGVRGTRCPVFPYTTLFRSRRLSEDSDLARRLPRVVHGDPVHDAPPQELGGRGADAGPTDEADMDRSEEHTSELQSRFDLVCRLLLEKKNLK